MSRRFTIRSLMIAIAVIGLGFGARQIHFDRLARLAAVRAQLIAAHQARFKALMDHHEREAAIWERRAQDYEAVNARVHGAIFIWKDVARVGDAADLDGRWAGEVAKWAHPDLGDSFAILIGPSLDWNRRLRALQPMIQSCRERATFHQGRRGMCWTAMSCTPEEAVFASELAEAPPDVPPYPPEFRAEYDAMPSPRKPAVERIPKDPDEIYRIVREKGQ